MDGSVPKEIVGNKKKLTWWQDEFWKHMVKKYPDWSGARAPAKPTHQYSAAAFQGSCSPEPAEGADYGNSERHQSVQQEKPRRKNWELTAENAALEKQLGAASKESVRKKLEISQKLGELEELHRMVDALPRRFCRRQSGRRRIRRRKDEENKDIKEAGFIWR